MRSEFTAKTKLLAWRRSGGVCECGCGTKLYPGGYHYDHVIPCGLVPDNSLDNCMVLARGHHGEKTVRDIAAIAKAKRVERKHLGIRKSSRWAYGRDSKWKRKITGEVVRR